MKDFWAWLWDWVYNTFGLNHLVDLINGNVDFLK